MACKTCVEDKMLKIWAYYRANQLDKANQLDYETIKTYSLKGINLPNEKQNIDSRKIKAIKIMNQKCPECDKSKPDQEITN